MDINYSPIFIINEPLSDDVKNVPVLEDNDNSDEMPVKCDRCDASYTNARSLSVHMTRTHPHECNRCCKHFDDAETLLGHIKSHDGDLTPCKCYICEKGFESKGSLHRHIKVNNYN